MSTTSPNMGLTIPTPNVTPGPEYATELEGSLNIIDSHDHSSGKGAPVGVSGLNLQGDLSHNGYRVTNVKSLIFSNQTASLASTDAKGIYCLNNDLYFVNGTTNVQITSGTSIAGASGNITNLVSPAYVQYNAGQYEFYSASVTAADIYGQDYTLYNNSLLTTVKITQSASSSYIYTLPSAVPSNNNAPLVMNTSGVTSASSAVTIASGGIIPTASATTDLGSSVNRFKDAYLGSLTTGTASISGTMSVSGVTNISATTASPLTVSSSNANPNITLQSTGVSASVAGAVIFSGANENGFTVAGMFQNIATDGSSSIDFVTTPAGARNSYRGVSRFSISGTGAANFASTLSVSGLLTGNGGAVFNAGVQVTSLISGAISGSSGTFSSSISATSGSFSGALSATSVNTDNVAIKHKKFTGTTNGSGVFTTAHGLTASKILSVSGKILDSISGAYLSVYANTTSSAGTRLSHDNTNVTIAIDATGSNTASQPATILITYEA